MPATAVYYLAPQSQHRCLCWACLWLHRGCIGMPREVPAASKAQAQLAASMATPSCTGAVFGCTETAKTANRGVFDFPRGSIWLRWGCISLHKGCMKLDWGCIYLHRGLRKAFWNGLADFLFFEFLNCMQKRLHGQSRPKQGQSRAKADERIVRVD